MTPNAYAIPDALRGRMQRYQGMALAVGVVGLLLCILGFVLSPEQLLRSYLVGYFFWTGLALGCLALLMVQYLSGGAWGIMIRRTLESATRTLPLMAILFLPLAFGVRTLYLWAHPGMITSDAVMREKAPYLNVPFFLVRAVLYFVIWLGLSWFLNKWSLDEDREGGPLWAKKLETLSAPGLLVFVLTITFASVDWIMSLDPHWYSTIFGLLILVGQGLSAFSFVIAAMILLAMMPPLAGLVSKKHLHDLGKLLLAFVMLWAYLSFSQLILIWSGNLPEEIPWYINRLNGGWQWIGLALLLFHFIFPFLMLLSQDLKKKPKALAAVAIWVICLRIVDVFWLVQPNFDKAAFRVSWMDFAAPLGIGGVWLALFLYQLRQRPLLPVNAPDLEKALAHGRHH